MSSSACNHLEIRTVVFLYLLRERGRPNERALRVFCFYFVATAAGEGEKRGRGSVGRNLQRQPLNPSH